MNIETAQLESSVSIKEDDLVSFDDFVHKIKEMMPQKGKR